MARIRSVHPALFTDEAWVSCSLAARLLIIGLWTDADDQGVFEWRSLQIKMRIYPADMVDVSVLLDELAAAGIIKAFEVEGKRYGAVKNFRKAQRPKKPNAIHPLPAALIDYVGRPGKGGTGTELEGDEGDPVPPGGGSDPSLKGGEFGTGTEPVPHSSGTGGEKLNQMEDGGEGRVEEDSPPTPPPVGRDDSEAYRKAMAAYPERGHVHTKPDAAQTEWLAAAGEIDAFDPANDPELVLLACVEAYSARLNAGHTGVPGFQTWLRKGQWKVWLPTVTKATGADPAKPQPWAGPAAIWDAVVEHAGKHLPLRGATAEDYAASWLGVTTWQDMPTKAVRARSGVVADRLKHDVGQVLADLGVAVIHDRKVAAA
jgi:hypothetical protein